MTDKLSAIKKGQAKSVALIGLLIGISFAGSHIKLFGTIAFDSLPAFLAALMLGPAAGAAVGFLGHIFTALLSGFPLSVYIHIVVALSMSATMAVFGAVHRVLEGKIPLKLTDAVSALAGVIFNGPVSLALSMGAMAALFGREAAVGLIALLPILILASAVNIFLALAVFRAVGKARENRT